MDSVTLITLPPHLREKIQIILAKDVHLPEDLRRDLSVALDSNHERDPHISDGVEITASSVQTIDEEVLLRLSKWAQGPGQKRLKKHGILSSDYGLVSLFAGTEVYVPPERVEFLKSTLNPEKPSPYLPSYLSPHQPLFSGYRALSKQLSTALNVLFSIVGSGAAVYMAAITGAGYKRETGVLLGLLAAVVVGISEGVLLWIFVYRVKENRIRGVKEWIGSASEGPKHAVEPTPERQSDDGDDPGAVEPGDTLINEKPAKREIRLRRRAIGTGT